MSVPFCIHVQLLIPIKASTWSGPVNALCQTFIVILANIFLAFRLVDWPLVHAADMILISNLQYLWPDK